MVSIRFHVRVEAKDCLASIGYDSHLHDPAGVGLNPVNIMELDGCILLGSEGDICATSLDPESLHDIIHEAS